MYLAANGESMMPKFLLGLAVGLVIGAAGTAAAAQLVGDNGYLIGWNVELNGETVCSDPYIWTSIREIECD